MSAFQPMLAHSYKDEDVKDYYVSEKLDGVRAVYKNSEFVTRNGNVINSPEWFTEFYPNITMDGELYTKRNDFNRLSGIVRKKEPIDEEWEDVIYMVFDLPEINEPYYKRYDMMRKKLMSYENLQVVGHYRMMNSENFDKFYHQLVDQGAEGLMLVKSNSYYANKRSKNLLKYKEFSDSEVVVDGYELGKGRNQGVLGSLIVHWYHPDMGIKEFKVGTGFTDIERKNYQDLFPVGSIHRVKYFELFKTGAPRHPVYEGERIDV